MVNGEDMWFVECHPAGPAASNSAGWHGHVR